MSAVVNKLDFYRKNGSPSHRNILLEATSSQKVCATSVSSGDQGVAPTLGQWPQCYRVRNEIDIFQISDKILNYALKHQTIITISKWISSVLYFFMKL